MNYNEAGVLSDFIYRRFMFDNFHKLALGAGGGGHFARVNCVPAWIIVDNLE